LLAWRVAAILLACLFALHVAGQSIELAQLKHAERDLDRSIDTLYRSTMAGAQAPPDARRQMEARLLAAHANPEGFGFLPALAALAAARSASPSLDIRTLSFNPSSLEMKVAAQDAASLDQINQRLRGAGWRADLTSGAAHGQTYEGRIQLKPPGSS
jgi:type II secretion system protein L